MLGPDCGRGGGASAVSNGSAGGPANGALISATERNTSGRTSAHQAATGEPKSCPTTAGDGAIAERRDQAERVAHQVEHAERAEVAVVVAVPAGGAAVAALVRRDHVIAGRRQRQHHLAPAVGELREAVQQQQAGPARLEAGLQHVHREAVDVVDEARADARGRAAC